jgi:hypothetical protein
VIFLLCTASEPGLVPTQPCPVPTAGFSLGVEWTEREPDLCVRSEDCAQNVISVLPTSASRGAPDADTFSIVTCYPSDVTFECPMT